LEDPEAAQLIAGLALALLTIFLAMSGRKEIVAQAEVEYTDPTAGTLRTLPPGSVIPRGEIAHVESALTKERRRSALGAILAGTDHRTSTSKTVVFAWTLAVAFGLLSLLIAIWLGDHGPWDRQVESGLQEEYLLLLGGPFAAAVLAKYAAVSNAESKPDAPVGEADAAQLINNDQGDTDLGDLQYVLFNVIALAFFLGDFIGGLATGFPDLPPLLTGLVLTSTGGYVAKKLLIQAAPTLTSVLPAAAAPGASVQVFGTNLAVPSTVSGTGKQLSATVVMGSREAAVTAHDLVLGNDRLTVTVPDAQPGSAPISAARADGAAARGPSGMNSLPFEVLGQEAP
jgi:hypothetical protein